MGSKNERGNLEPLATTGLTIPDDKFSNVFKCIACSQDFLNPVELTCGHMGCKRCIGKLAECPLCHEKIRTIGWKNRPDVDKMHNCCRELWRLFDLESRKLAHPNEDKERSPIPLASPGGQAKSKTDKSRASVNTTTTETDSETEEDKDASRPEPPVAVTTVGAVDVDTCETHFEGNTELFGNPYTPFEPYPFLTQPMPGTATKRLEEIPPKENGPSTTETMPLIDTQVFSVWDTQDVGTIDKSQVKQLEEPEHEEEAEPQRLTQSQPLDLTLQVPGAAEEVSSYGPRRLAFNTSPALPLDLRVQFHSMKTSGFKAITTAGEINNNTEMRLTQLRLPPTVQPTAEDFDSQFTSPVTQRFVQRLAILETPNPAPLPPTTPKRPKVGNKLNTPGKKLELEAIAGETNTQFGDEDDRLFLEVEEDSLISVNGNKRKQEAEEEGSSDEEYFPPSLPEAKRPKIYSTEKSRNFSNKPDKVESPPAKNHDHSSKNPVPFPSPLSSPVPVPPPNVVEEEEEEVIRASQEDLFCSSWTPPENLLETLSPARKFIFCTTRLSSDQVNKLEKLCTLCNGEIRKDFSEEVTHLLLNMEHSRISYTLKYFHAIARKKWVLTFGWVEECIRECRIVPEEPFETSNFRGSDIGVKTSRLSSSHLFQDFNFYVPYDFKVAFLSSTDCKHLLTALGAVVFEDLPNCNKRMLIVGDNSTMNYKKMYQDRHWLTVSWDWILECILHYRLTPFLADHILTPDVDGIVLSQVAVPRPLLTL